MPGKYKALSRHKIPFQIELTNEAVQWLMCIAETTPFLDESLSSPLEVKLLRKAKIRAITYSNQIEGNALGESEVTAVLRGQRVAGPPKDVKEARNYHAALDYVETLATDPRPLKVADMCDIQRLVTAGTIAEKMSGRIRTVPVSIVNAANGSVLADCPEPHALKDLLDDLWSWLEETAGSNPFLRAFAFHFIAVSIHPFADGNGRTMRLMQHLLLLRSGVRLARFVPSETAIMRQRDRYYSVIRQSQALGSLRPVVEFLAECFALSAAEVVEDGRRLLKESAGKTPEGRRKRLLRFAKNKQRFSMQDIVAWMPGVPRRTLERDVAALVKAKALTGTGKNKARTYRVKG